jgi:hypothetical protein
MDLIHSYDRYGNPPDEYYESGRTVRDKGPGFGRPYVQQEQLEVKNENET